MNVRKRTVSVFVVGAATAPLVLGWFTGKATAQDCPHAGIECPTVWKPVICNDGVIYSNKCVARQQCAKGCVPYDDGGATASAAEPGECPPRPRFCPRLWAPLICDDGRVYANDCWAARHCATGCVPYDEGLAGGAPSDGCPPKPKFCPQLWAPVICDDGKVYPNDCWAAKRCATGCEPYGEMLAADRGRNVLRIDDDDVCPRLGYNCPDYHDPVLCDDGMVYLNLCEAWVWCATNCQALRR